MAQRHNLYTGIHKAVRLLLTDLVTRASHTEFNDRASVASLIGTCDEAFAMLDGHARHEDTFIMPVLATTCPDVFVQIESAHHTQEEQFVSLRAQLVAIDTASVDAADAGQRFVVSLCRVVGELITHMSDEEELVMPALWNALDEAAILDIHHRLLASIAPPELLSTMRWMIPAINHQERVELLVGTRANAPPPVFGALLGLARQHLGAAEFARLESDLAPPSQRAA